MPASHQATPATKIPPAPAKSGTTNNPYQRDATATAKPNPCNLKTSPTASPGGTTASKTITPGAFPSKSCSLATATSIARIPTIKKTLSTCHPNNWYRAYWVKNNVLWRLCTIFRRWWGMGRMSKEYPLVPLQDVLTHRSEFIEIDDFEVYKRCRVQLHAQGIVERDQVQGTEIKTKKQKVCRAKEFLVAEIDAKVGGFGVVPESLDGAIVSSHYFLFGIDETLLNVKFLDFYIRTQAFLNQVRAKGSTNYAALRPSDVLSYKIPLPPLEEQCRIVACIDALAAKIE